MRFEPPLTEGRLIRRYKRFLADVELLDGRVVVAHCQNPGSMATCMTQGGRVWLSRSDNPRRKLAYTWELSEVENALVCVNTARANEMVAEALAGGVIEELAGYERVTREVRYGENSRLDFLLERDDQACYLEVKSVSLRGGEGVAAFPDSVTVRGQKHLRELMAVAQSGLRAVLLFVCNRTDARMVQPADDIDPAYGYGLRRAAASGVEILSYRSRLGPQSMALDQRIPVHLPAFDYTPPPARPVVSAGKVKRGAKKTARPHGSL